MDNSILEKDITNYKNGKFHIDEIINKYKPFIYSSIGEYTGRYVDESDEMITVAMMAFKEAVDNFQHEKGSCYFYIKMVIKSRLIDYSRKENKYSRNQITLLDKFDSDNDEVINKIEEKESIKHNSILQENEIRRMEIKEFVEELSLYDITLSQLESICPKKKELRNKYIDTAKFIVSNMFLKEHILSTKRIPINEIMKNVAINRKQIERGRKYIIALIIIKSGDYTMLSQYID